MLLLALPAAVKRKSSDPHQPIGGLDGRVTPLVQALRRLVQDRALKRRKLAAALVIKAPVVRVLAGIARRHPAVSIAPACHDCRQSLLTHSWFGIGLPAGCTPDQKLATP